MYNPPPNNQEEGEPQAQPQAQPQVQPQVQPQRSLPSPQQEPQQRPFAPPPPPKYDHTPIVSAAPLIEPGGVDRYPVVYQPQQRSIGEAAQRAGVIADRTAERALSALAHGVIIFGLFGISMLISLAVSGLIRLYGIRSPQVRFHSTQACLYQLAVFVIDMVLLVIFLFSGGFAVFQWIQGRSDWGSGPVSCLSVVALLIWWVGSLVYGAFGAVMVLMGKEFKYPIIGDWLERRKR